MFQCFALNEKPALFQDLSKHAKTNFREIYKFLSVPRKTEIPLVVGLVWRAALNSMEILGCSTWTNKIIMTGWLTWRDHVITSMDVTSDWTKPATTEKPHEDEKAKCKNCEDKPTKLRTSVHCQLSRDFTLAHYSSCKTSGRKLAIPKKICFRPF